MSNRQLFLPKKHSWTRQIILSKNRSTHSNHNRIAKPLFSKYFSSENPHISLYWQLKIYSTFNFMCFFWSLSFLISYKMYSRYMCFENTFFYCHYFLFFYLFVLFIMTTFNIIMSIISDNLKCLTQLLLLTFCTLLLFRLMWTWCMKKALI